MDEQKLHSCGCEDESCGCGEHEHEHDACGCGCDHEHGPAIVDLEDENGNVIHCEVVDEFEYKDNDYVLVQNPQDESVYLFKIVTEGDEDSLVVPEDEEFDEVRAFYENSLEEE